MVTLRNIQEIERVDKSERHACVRFVRFDLRAVGAPEVLVQHAIEGRFLCVNMDRRCLVLSEAVGVRAGEVHEVETGAQCDSLVSESSQAKRAKSGARR